MCKKHVNCNTSTATRQLQRVNCNSRTPWGRDHREQPACRRTPQGCPQSVNTPTAWAGTCFGRPGFESATESPSKRPQCADLCVCLCVQVQHARTNLLHSPLIQHSFHNTPRHGEETGRVDDEHHTHRLCTYGSKHHNSASKHVSRGATVKSHTHRTRYRTWKVVLSNSCDACKVPAVGIQRQMNRESTTTADRSRSIAERTRGWRRTAFSC